MSSSGFEDKPPACYLRVEEQFQSFQGIRIVKLSSAAVVLSLLGFLSPAFAAGAGAKAGAPEATAQSRPVDPALAFPPPKQVFPLYGDDPVPNSKPTPNEESGAEQGFIRNVSRPEILVYLPAKMRATGTSLVVLPGGGYAGLTFNWEGIQQAEFLADHGVAAFVVKYRLPSDQTMIDKSIGPLQDAQQAIRFVRQRAKEWDLDPNRVGVIGFSAGGHLASTLATRFDKALVPNPDQINLRPDFAILVYPVISMQSDITHQGSRDALLGKSPSDEQVREFSNELQVTGRTPPTLILHATDDRLVDVSNSLRYYDALRHAGVPVEMRLFEKGQHGFFMMPRTRWQSAIIEWMVASGWMYKGSSAKDAAINGRHRSS
jgi:acetyl esterase/lipase